VQAVMAAQIAAQHLPVLAQMAVIHYFQLLQHQ
jgi:hypothetical protein